MHLPNDHTAGADTNGPSATTAYADNDVAVGKVVDAISHSSFWSNSVIFVVEDDAQGDFDHVDAHRSICMVISPYTKRHQTISSFYNQPGLIHTMEQILGLPPMNQMDAIGPLMSDCFNPVPDYSPFMALPSNVPLNVMFSSIDLKKLTPENRRWVERGRKLDLSRPDRADPEVLNRIAWITAKGNAPYPTRYANATGNNLRKLGLMLIGGNHDDDD